MTNRRAQMLTGAMVLTLLLVRASCAQNMPNEMFLPDAPAPTMTAAQAGIMAKMTSESGMMGMSIMQLDPNLQDTLLARSSLLIRFSPTLSLEVHKQAFETTSSGFIWRGTVTDTREPVLLMGSGTAISGTIRRGDRVYVIRPMGGGLHAMLEESTAAMPADHMTMPQGMRLDAPMGAPKNPPGPGAAGAGAAPAVDGSPQIVIRLLFAYTPAAAGHYENITRDAIQLAIEETNEVFRRSQLGHIRFVLAHSYRTDYVEQGTHLDHLIHFAEPNDGVMDEMHALRDQHRAAIAVLLVDDTSSCGLSAAVGAEEYQAYTVLHHACAAANLSLAHEIGHLFGARHDPAIDPSATPFNYGHGFVNGNKWRTIMSYGKACGGCMRLPLFSTPNVMVEGEPAGIPGLYDNAKVVRDAAPRVSQFR